MSAQDADLRAKVDEFLRRAGEKMAPAVTEAVMRDASGHFEVHYAHGQFQRVRRIDTL